MSRFLVMANDLVGERMAGPAIRAWEIARALSSLGIEVVLAAPGAELPAAPFETVAFDSRGEALRAAAERSDGLLVQGAALAQYPFLAALDKPIAVDIYDPFVLESLSARAGELPGGRWRHHQGDLALLLGQLERGDYFVCASETQRDFWLGMLTALGRVNPATYDADPELRQLVGVVPFGLPDAPPVVGGPRLKGVVPGIGPDTFVLLWGGGIWSWFDPLSLVRAVGQLADRRPNLRLLFLGAAEVPSQFRPNQDMAARARRLAQALGLLDRVVFFHPTWVPYAERAGYLLEADLGVSTHLAHVETRFAFRTRLLDCIWAGLPMVVTGGDVLADVVRAHRLGWVVPPEDAGALAAAIEAAMDEPGGRTAYAARFVGLRAGLTWSRAVAPLAAFARSPRRAPDRPAGPGSPRELPATAARQLPARAVELLRQGGPLLLLEELARYLRWRRRPRS